MKINRWEVVTMAASFLLLFFFTNPKDIDIIVVVCMWNMKKLQMMRS